MTNAIGDYFSNVIGMSLVMTPYTGEDWVERWTIFTGPGDFPGRPLLAVLSRGFPVVAPSASLFWA